MGASLLSHDETVEPAVNAPGTEDFRESAMVGGDDCESGVEKCRKKRLKGFVW